MQPEFLTLSEVAKRLRVTVDTVRIYVKTKQLPATKIGRQYLVLPQDVDAFIEKRRTKE